MRDVAERVGISRRLVSIVLRGAPGASDESRDRILAAARELGYHPDETAQAPERQPSGQLGVFFSLRQPFEVDLVDALYAAAAAEGLTLALSATSTGHAQQVALDELAQQNIDALIIIDSDERSVSLSKLPADLPVLLLGGSPSATSHDSVPVENEGGTAVAVKRLVGLGHSRIAYIGPEHGPSAAERLAAYRKAMRGLELTEIVIHSDATEAGGYRAAMELLERDDAARSSHAAGDETGSGSGAPADPVALDLPSALICVNDQCAIGALQTLVRAGVRVPARVSIVGFGDSERAALPPISLSSVSPSIEKMAQFAISVVRARLADPAAPRIVRRVPPTMRVRGSTASIRR